MRRFVKDGLVRPSKVPVNECSQVMYPAKIGYSFGYDTPRANHLKRHLANESSPEMSPQCNTVTKLMHEILSRHTVTKYVHDVRLRVIQHDARKRISQQQQMHDRHVQPSQLNV